MTWYEVPVQIWIEAEDCIAAMNDVIDSLPDGRIIMTDEVKEVSQADMEAYLHFQDSLDKAIEDADNGIAVTDPEHPGVKFSLQAAAQLITLEAEDSKLPPG